MGSVKFSSADNQFQLPLAAQSIDVWFPILHGPNVKIVRFKDCCNSCKNPMSVMEFWHPPQVWKNCDDVAFCSSRIGTGKVYALSRWAWQQESSSWCEHIEIELGYPCFVKPSNLGSSVDISKVRTRAELEVAIAPALSYDLRIAIEQGVIAREIECAVLGNENPKPRSWEKLLLIAIFMTMKPNIRSVKPS
jgi:D-alanine-D-alanine ligase